MNRLTDNKLDYIKGGLDVYTGSEYVYMSRVEVLYLVDEIQEYRRIQNKPDTDLVIFDRLNRAEAEIKHIKELLHNHKHYIHNCD